MPHLKFARPAAPVDPRLARLLWQWLIFGVALCTLLPAARAYNHWIGWLWYWLIAAPAIALCVLHRARWLGTWRSASRRARTSLRPSRPIARNQAKRERTLMRAAALARAG